MLAFIMYRDEGARAEDCKEGDIIQIRPDSFEGSLGISDKKSYLVAKFPDPPGYPADINAADFYIAPEYGVVDGGGNVDVTRARQYTVDWATKFTAEQRTAIRDPEVSFDGALTSTLFALSDIVPKN